MTPMIVPSASRIGAAEQLNGGKRLKNAQFR